MRIAYLLAGADLGGGTKVVLQHATLLAATGHEVQVVGRGPLPADFGFAGRYVDAGSDAPRLASQDLVIATFWTTLAPAVALELGPVAHFCQGYEGEIPHFRGERAAIEAAYATPIPALAVTPRLVSLIEERFGRPARLAPPPADRSLAPRRRFAPRRRPWVALFGVFEAEVKGIVVGLDAIARLRARGIDARTLRISVFPLSDAERQRLAPDLYLRSVPPRRALAELGRCDLLLFPSGIEEGFGLPLLEAMVLGVPAVASRTPGLEFVTGGTGARLVAAGDADAFAGAAAELLGSRAAWRELRRRGFVAARRFDPPIVAETLDAAVRWAAAIGQGAA